MGTFQAKESFYKKKNWGGEEMYEMSILGKVVITFIAHCVQIMIISGQQEWAGTRIVFGPLRKYGPPTCWGESVWAQHDPLFFTPNFTENPQVNF